VNIVQKFKETAFSVLPVMVIVFVLGVTAAPLGINLMLRFLLGGLLLIAGLTVFLIGVDIGILPLGEMCGSELTKKRNLPLLLVSAFFMGFLVTAAEPDIQVLADQVRSVFSLVNKRLLVMMISAGVGLFITLGLLRTVLHFSLKIILALSYIVVFILAFIGPRSFVGIGFDSGGATTGPMTVPFIMSLGLGVSAVRTKTGHSDENSLSDSFGLTGMASVGPVLAVLLYGFVLSHHAVTPSPVSVSGSEFSAVQGIPVFMQVFPFVLKEAALSLIPIILLFIVFQFSMLHMPPYQVKRMITGFLYSFAGLVIFLTGVNGGFMEAGRTLGALLGIQAVQNGGWWTVLLVCTGLLIGAVVVCAEPAVWVLTDQVESLSGGTIKRKVLLIFLAGGAAAAIGLAMIRAVSGFSLMYILIPGYAVALLLMPFCPKIFTGIAFDSGGVASGPISSTFVLSFTLGAAQAGGNRGDIFGVIALIAMMPLIAIQIFGLVFSYKKGDIGK